jgi:hypothetical protein
MAQIEIFHERARRRWTEADRRRLVAETLAPGATVHAVARRHGVNTSQLFTWRKQLRLELEPLAAPLTPGFAAVAIAPVMPPSVADVPMPSGPIDVAAREHRRSGSRTEGRLGSRSLRLERYPGSQSARLGSR